MLACASAGIGLPAMVTFPCRCEVGLPLPIRPHPESATGNRAEIKTNSAQHRVMFARKKRLYYANHDRTLRALLLKPETVTGCGTWEDEQLTPSRSHKTPLSCYR